MANIKFPFNVPMMLLVPAYETKKGVPKKVYPDYRKLSDEYRLDGNFRTFGGTETTVNGVLTIADTAVVQTYYRPDIQSDCAVVLLESGKVYEIMNEPEDIDMMHQFMQFKVKRLKGGV